MCFTYCTQYYNLWRKWWISIPIRFHTAYQEFSSKIVSKYLWVYLSCIILCSSVFMVPLFSFLYQSVYHTVFRMATWILPIFSADCHKQNCFRWAVVPIHSVVSQTLTNAGCLFVYVLFFLLCFFISFPFISFFYLFVDKKEIWKWTHSWN